MQNTFVDFTPVLNVVIQFLALLVGGLLTWALTKWGKKLGVDRDTELGKIIENSIQRGLSLAANEAKKVAANRLGKVDLHSPVIAGATTYVIQSAPDALKHFGITEERLMEMIMARAVERTDIPTTHTVTPLAENPGKDVPATKP